MLQIAARLIMSAAAVLLALYAVVLIYMYTQQRKLQYFPSPTERTPESVGVAGVQVIHITTPDGEKLLAWYAPAKAGQPTILYFHGNGGGISDRPLKITSFIAKGFGILALSYRGYEGSSGNPSETGLITDGLAAYDWLTAQGVTSTDIMLLGESLGTGVAVQVAAQRQIAAMALEAPYSSTVSVAEKAYWYLPVRLLMKDQFKSIDFISKVKAPLLVQHGKLDVVVPYVEGEALFAAASEPKQMRSYDNMGHDLISDPAAWETDAAFFEAQYKR